MSYKTHITSTRRRGAATPTGLGTGNDLEREQSRHSSRQDSNIEDNEAQLTEVAAPPPAAEDDSKPDGLEKEEQRAKERRTEDGGWKDNEAFLTEAAAPPPADYRGPVQGDDSESARDRRSQLSDSPDAVHEPDLEKEEERTQQPKKSFLNHTELASVSWVIFFSILGTLARLGVEAITTYPYAPFSSTVLWANVGGSFFLGFLLEDRQLFRYSADPKFLSSDDKAETHRQVDKSKKTLPLYIGLATGFCGSFTSFSSFITDAFLALTNALPTASPTSPYHTIPSTTIQHRNGGYSFEAVLAILIIQVAVSVSSLKAGAHLAAGLEHVFPSLPTTFMHRFLDPLSILLGWGCWLGAVLLCIWPVHSSWRYRTNFAMAFAPPGALLRFYLSKSLNSRIPSFPLGTFSVNIFGVVIAGMCYDLQHSRTVIGGVRSSNAVSCAALEGVIMGFCGCTTTVSTWVAELNSLRRRHAWFYGLMSLGVALGFQLVIMGSMGWTIGFDGSCTA